MLVNAVSSKCLDELIMENEVDLRCKETGLFIVSIEPTEEGEDLFLILSDGSEVTTPPERIAELFELVPLVSCV